MVEFLKSCKIDHYYKREVLLGIPVSTLTLDICTKRGKTGYHGVQVSVPINNREFTKIYKTGRWAIIDSGS